MNIVITMAGNGMRFRQAGHHQPKYKIIVRHKSLFEWALSSLTLFYNHHFIFIVKKEDLDVSFITSAAKLLGIDNFTIVPLDKETSGQAETALLSSPYCDKEQPMFIYNIDTYISGNQLVPSKMIGHGCIPCFSSKGDHWSFVRISEQNTVVEVREKKRISSLCSIGAYYFSSVDLYNETYNQIYGLAGWKEFVLNEQYIAPMYNYLIQQGKIVNYYCIDAEYVHVLGTPEELKEFDLNFNE